ncbi:hypothetical protein EJ08DRAFT_709340 [Tothia fuscella]|uniref:DUF659 domain-containing protein n=1 Tax=Tothia fuscella TaxID=1048955 RepID=A0A9P4NDU7_9PEZI|nr:hypothetical protein EJ08DRAFT_709340 [Tothia fuscella]
MDKVIQEVGPDNLAVITTDNTSNMVTSWYKIQEKYPKIKTLGCGAHWVNRTVEELMKLHPIKEYFKLIIKLKIINSRYPPFNYPAERDSKNKAVIQVAILNKEKYNTLNPTPEALAKYNRIKSRIDRRYHEYIPSGVTYSSRPIYRSLIFYLRRQHSQYYAVALMRVAHKERPVNITRSQLEDMGSWLKKYYEKRGDITTKRNSETVNKDQFKSEVLDLYYLTRHALLIAPTSGAAERNYIRKAEQLVYIYWNLRIRERMKDWVEEPNKAEDEAIMLDSDDEALVNSANDDESKADDIDNDIEQLISYLGIPEEESE